MDHPERRHLLVRLATLLALPCIGVPAPAQTTDKPARIGLIAFGAQEMLGQWEQELIEGLRQRGYVEGRNVVFAWRHAEGYGARLPEMASELAALKLDAIVTTCTPTTRLMLAATQTTPLVMAAVSDPVGQGLIASYPRPGGNITGLASQFEDIAAKLLQLLHEAAPKASPVAVAFRPGNAVHPILLREMDAAARTLDVRVLPLAIGRETDIAAAFDGAKPHGYAALLVLPDDPFLIHLRRRFIDVAARHRLPTLFGLREAVDEGGLMSYGESIGKSYFRAAHYVDKVLRGANPAETPVEQPTRFELVINLKTAKALGLSLPQSLLVRADDVIER